MFEKLVKALEAKKIPCEVKQMTMNGKTDLTICLGNNYPDRLCNKAFAVATKVGAMANLSVCAEMHTNGLNIEKQARVAGGPKRY